MSAKILIVDDSQIVLKALSTKLTAAGYKVFTEPDGGGAISTVRKERPDLLILDIGFPPDVAYGGGVGWDGFLIMQWLRRMDEAKDIPIIVITSGDPEKLRDKALAAGAAAFFTKPINNDQLLAAIQQALNKPASAG